MNTARFNHNIRLYLSQMKKYIYLPFLGAIGIAALIFSYSKRSDCFSPGFALSNEEFNLGPTPIPAEILPILKHRYTFLASGNQSYAFENEDHTIILKLFKFHTLKERKKIDRLKNSLILANAYSKNNTGILFLHFPASIFEKTFIKDKAGRNHQIDLGKYVFVLQKKANILKSVFKNLLDKGDLTELKQKLFLLFEMFANDLKQGIYDGDHNVMSNTGFVGNKPIRIDFGKLTFNVEMKTSYHGELHKIATQRILPWVRKYYPAYEREIAIALEQIQKKL